MAVYEYKCECGRQEDVVIQMSELADGNEPDIRCLCGKRMKRVFGTPGIKWNTTGATVRTGRTG
jgi:predicted nucleic acid-binding Zn ribbon protein